MAFKAVRRRAASRCSIARRAGGSWARCDEANVEAAAGINESMTTDSSPTHLRVRSEAEQIESSRRSRPCPRRRPFGTLGPIQGGLSTVRSPTSRPGNILGVRCRRSVRRQPRTGEPGASQVALETVRWPRTARPCADDGGDCHRDAGAAGQSRQRRGAAAERRTRAQSGRPAERASGRRRRRGARRRHLAGCRAGSPAAWDAVASALARRARDHELGRAAPQGVRQGRSTTRPAMLRASIIANDPVAAAYWERPARQGEHAHRRSSGVPRSGRWARWWRPRRALASRWTARSGASAQGWPTPRPDGYEPASPARWTPRRGATKRGRSRDGHGDARRAQSAQRSATPAPPPRT